MPELLDNVFRGSIKHRRPEGLEDNGGSETLPFKSWKPVTH